MQDTAEVTRRLWSLCAILRDEGISYQSYLTELTQLLFLKLASDIGVDTELASGERWQNLLVTPPTQMLDNYRHILLGLQQATNKTVRDIFRGSSTEIASPSSFARLVTEIEAIGWGDIDLASFGNVYEGLIEKGAQESRNGAGQYFTPRAVVDAIVEVTSPSPGELVYDPAAGTAGFLVSAGQYSLGTRSKSAPRLIGRELVASVRRLGLMNMLAHGLDGELEVGDSLAENRGAWCDVCLTNPPFGARGLYASDRPAQVKLPTNNKQLAFLQHVVESLRSGGRAAVVVPDNVLFEQGTASVIRQSILKDTRLHTILHLPPGIFYATGIRTSVLFLEVGGYTNETWYFDMRRANGTFGKRRQLNASDFREFVQCYGADPRGGSDRLESSRFKRRTLNEIESNDFSLLFPLEEEDNGSLEDVSEILARLSTSLEAAQSSVATLSDLLARSSNAEFPN